MNRVARLAGARRSGEIVHATLAEIAEDNCFGLAAQLGFYFFLALFPALLVLVALIGYFPIDNGLSELMTALAAVAPHEVLILVREQLAEIQRESKVGVLTFGILGALWTSSAAMVAMIIALNNAFNVAEKRRWWRRRLVAVALTIALALFTVASLVLLLVGPGLAGWAAAWLGLGDAFAVVWSLLRWPLSVVLVVFAVNLVYYFAPNRKTDWAWVTPGWLVATLLWLLASLVFKLYVTTFGKYNETYGAIAGVAVLLLWFYVSALAILVGAELNGVIERRRRTI